MSKAGIKDNYLKIPPDSRLLPDRFILDGYTWLLLLEEEEYEKARKIRALLPESTWDTYYSWGDFNTVNEMVLWRKASRELRDVVVSRNRPDFFKRVRVEAKIRKVKKEIKK